MTSPYAPDQHTEVGFGYGEGPPSQTTFGEKISEPQSAALPPGLTGRALPPGLAKQASLPYGLAKRSGATNPSTGRAGGDSDD